jgi:proteasome accessory factor B
MARHRHLSPQGFDPSVARACGRSALGRIIWIHERLGNHRPATAASIAEALEVSNRTVKRDIETMRGAMGAPIAWDPSTHTYFYERPCDVLPLLRLSSEEAIALVAASRAFSAWGGSALGRALTRALGKIAAIAGGAISLPASEIGELLFQSDGTAADGEDRFFPVLLEAIQRRRELTLSYRKPHAAAAEKRTVHPLHLALLAHQWTLIAHDPVRNGPRKFKLSRIVRAEAGIRRFAPPAGFDVRDYLRGSLGLFTGDREYEVRIAFDAFASGFVRERPLHPSQSVVERPDGGIEATFRLNNLIDIQRGILAWGAHAEALAPPELRESLRAESAALNTRYATAPEPGLPAEENVSRARSLRPR